MLTTYLCVRTGSITRGVMYAVAVNVVIAILAIAALGCLGGMPLQAIVAGMSRRSKVQRAWANAVTAAGCAGRPGRNGGTRPVPRLRGLRPTAAGVSAWTNLGDVGKTVDELASHRQALAAVVGCREVYVRQGRHPGLAHIEFVWGDTLLRTIRLRDLTPAPPGQLTFGVTEDRQPASVEMDTSILIAGLAGSGKSGCIWALLASVVQKKIPYRLIVIDPKGGMELRQLRDRPETARYAIMPDEIAQALTDTVREMRDRAKLLGDRGMRKYVPTAEMPFTIVIVDEFLALTSFAPQSVKGRIERDLGLLITQGRAPGFVGWFATQGTQLDALGRARTFIPQRLCLATDDIETTIAALGTDARHNARCDKISLRTQRGTGFLQVDGERGFTRWRSAYVTDPETRDVARGVLPEDAFSVRPDRPSRRRLRPTMPSWARPGGGDEEEPERVALYHWVGHDEESLYVGISDDPDRRMRQHIDGKPWVEEAVRIDLVDWFDTRREALDAEREMIHRVRPRYNVVHNRRNAGSDLPIDEERSA